MQYQVVNNMRSFKFTSVAATEIIISWVEKSIAENK